jgi:signal transduction histidine kinase
MTYGFRRAAPDGGPELHYLIATDERILDAIVSSFERDLWRWLTLLAGGLLATGTVVILYALKPLDRLGRAVAAVRQGAARRMDQGWPSEIAPLVTDLNALLGANEAMVARARLEAGNLAHSLRTSLAILTDEAETLRNGAVGDSGATLLEQCRRIERQLDWHLARARAGTRHGAVTPVPEAVAPILTAMQRLHADRGRRTRDPRMSTDQRVRGRQPPRRAGARPWARACHRPGPCPPSWRGHPAGQPG